MAGLVLKNLITVNNGKYIPCFEDALVPTFKSQMNLILTKPHFTQPACEGVKAGISI